MGFVACVLAATSRGPGERQDWGALVLGVLSCALQFPWLRGIFRFTIFLWRTDVKLRHYVLPYWASSALLLALTVLVTVVCRARFSGEGSNLGLAVIAVVALFFTFLYNFHIH